MLTKSELVADHSEHPSYGTTLTFPLAEYSRLHQTSATTGRPVRWLDTPASWDAGVEQAACPYSCTKGVPPIRINRLNDN